MVLIEEGYDYNR